MAMDYNCACFLESFGEVDYRAWIRYCVGTNAGCVQLACTRYSELLILSALVALTMDSDELLKWRKLFAL